MSLFSDPHWPRASSLLSSAPANAKVRLCGVPINASISPGRCDLAPTAIREGLSKFSGGQFGRDELPFGVIYDSGDLSGSTPELVAQARSFVSSDDMVCVLLGGDNTVTYPGVLGLADRFGIENVGLITLDAHLDMRDISLGLINGNPIRHLVDNGLAGGHIFQIGLQNFANSFPYIDIAKSIGMRAVISEDVHERGVDNVAAEVLSQMPQNVKAIYLDIDLDIMDMAFAPGCPGARPGGLLPWQLRKLVRTLAADPRVQGADIVELDPSKDIDNVTSITGSAVLLEFLAGVLSR